MSLGLSHAATQRSMTASLAGILTRIWAPNVVKLRRMPPSAGTTTYQKYSNEICEIGALRGVRMPICTHFTQSFYALLDQYFAETNF